MIPSPCISVCTMDEDTGYCKGCFRSLNEVASWLYFSDNEKIKIIEQLSLRKQKP